MSSPPQPERWGGGIRVVVADDHHQHRQVMRAILETEPDISVVAEAADGKAAVHNAVSTAPDLVLMDIQMPVLDGIAACRELARVAPAVRIVMLTMSDDEADLFEAMRAGARGYVLKSASADALVAAVRAVAAGQAIIPPTMAGQLVGEFARAPREAAGDLAGPSLTERESEVLRWVARGASNKEIARQLFISENTVKNHVRNILDKLQLHSRVEAATYAIRRNLLDDR